MTIRAGVVVTGTEVLSGIITDRNGPWISERLRELGIQITHIVTVGDRRQDLQAALQFLADAPSDLIITSGGLGPTADDLTAEVVAEFVGQELVLDTKLEERIFAILSSLRSRWATVDPQGMRAANRKQALVPTGATILDPVGTAPGFIVSPAQLPIFLVLPGPPSELQPMWTKAWETAELQALRAQAPRYERGMLRLIGLPESALAQALLEIEADLSAGFEGLEITTCLRGGELEVSTTYEVERDTAYREFVNAMQARFEDALFSTDGSTVDDQIAALLKGKTIAVGESCTGGRLAARLTARPGASAYFVGAVVAYNDEIKKRLLGVPRELLDRYGAVSEEVAQALAVGAVKQLGAQYGLGVTGIAGPGGGTEEKPVGTVCFAVATAAGVKGYRTVRIPGDREAVQQRATTVALHLLRQVLLAK